MFLQMFSKKLFLCSTASVSLHFAVQDFTAIASNAVHHYVQYSCPCI
jgi:hypothetical protein